MNQLAPDVSKTSKHSVISDTESSDDEDKGKTWVDNFLELPNSDWFCRVPNEYLRDSFNTYGMDFTDKYSSSAYSAVVGDKSNEYDSFDSDSEEKIESCAERIYGLIHSRYIFTDKGLSEMLHKYKNGVFGKCPRLSCNGHNMIPIGLNDKLGCGNVKLYCPNCKEVYHSDPGHSELDGAYFTTSFPHYFLLEIYYSDNQTKFNDSINNTSESQSTKK